jgi:streptogramin lyase
MVSTSGSSGIESSNGREGWYSIGMGHIALLLLLGCGREPQCADLKVREDLANHVQPYEVAIDVERRRVYSTALGSQAVLAYDADTHEVLQDYPLGTSPLTTPDLEIDPDGNLWIVANNDPAIVRFEKATGDRRIYWNELDGARDLVPRAEGGAVVLGRSGASNNALRAFDDQGEVVASLELEAAARGLVALDGFERVGVALEGELLLLLDSADLSEAGTCPHVMQRVWRGAQLDDGTVVLSGEGSIGTACVERPQAWRVGEENMEVISLGDHALVLDRIGLEEGFDPNLGIGRLVDADGVYDRYVTAKNTGFGALDPSTGLVWANSEGTSEIVIFDPETGDLDDAIEVGTFLDGLAADPEDTSVLFATGRLSDTIVRLEGVTPTASSSEVHWPYSPIVDVQRDLLWVLSHTESTLHGLDRQDLTLERSFDPGLGSNTLLSFGTIMLNTERGSLFFAESQRDLLLEIDPDSGEELGRWELGGPPIEDRDQVGELAVRASSEDGMVYVVRSNDARVQRLDPDSGSLQTEFMPEDVGAALSVGHRTDFLRIYPQHGLLYIGGKAVRLEDLSRWEDRDLPVTRVAGPHPVKKGQWIAVDDARRHIVRLDGDGTELGRMAFASHELYATVFEMSPETRSVTMTRALHGMVCSFPVSSLR